MKFAYSKYPDNNHPKGYIEVPEVTVRLSYRGNYEDVRCLVDSGADECVFHSSVAENLGIDLESGEPRIYYPVGNQPIHGFIHKLSLQVRGFDERVEIEAGFTEDSQWNILGQSGFFDNYEVTFWGYRKSFEVKSRSHARGRKITRVRGSNPE